MLNRFKNIVSNNRITNFCKKKISKLAISITNEDCNRIGQIFDRICFILLLSQSYILSSILISTLIMLYVFYCMWKSDLLYFPQYESNFPPLSIKIPKGENFLNSSKISVSETSDTEIETKKMEKKIIEKVDEKYSFTSSPFIKFNNPLELKNPMVSNDLKNVFKKKNESVIEKIDMYQEIFSPPSELDKISKAIDLDKISKEKTKINKFINKFMNKLKARYGTNKELLMEKGLKHSTKFGFTDGEMNEFLNQMEEYKEDNSSSYDEKNKVQSYLYFNKDDVIEI
jgi:hypothetical protein